MNDVLLIVAFVMMFIAGCLTGVAFTIRFVFKKVVGSIKVNNSDPEEPPYIFAEFNKDISVVLREKYIILTVDTNYLNTQK